MRVTKQVEFEADEVEKATREGLINLASKIIGEPKEDEEYSVEIRSWRSSAEVSIVKKVDKVKDQSQR